MIKKDIYDGDLKARLRASAQDRLHRFIFADGMMRGGILNATQMVNEMRANHELGPIETLLLGQAYMAGALLTFNLKGKDRIALHIECSGAVKGLDVEANVFGEVRGYLKNSVFSKDLDGDVSSVSTMLGAGFLTVTKYLEDAKTPYSGKVVLEYGSLAEDLANYFVQSEQTPTAFVLSIHFNDENQVDGAGALVIQAMPGADDDVVKKAEATLHNLSSLGELFSAGAGADQLVLEHFCDMTPQLLENHRVEFFCRCSEKVMTGYLSRLPQKDLKEMAASGPFPLEIRCHNCNSVYRFGKVDLEAMVKGE